MSDWFSPLPRQIRQPINLGTSPVQGTVTRRAGNQVWYTVKTFNDTSEFGPATLPAVAISPGGTDGHTHAVVFPERGSEILVVYAGGSPKHAWVVAW